MSDIGGFFRSRCAVVLRFSLHANPSVGPPNPDEPNPAVRTLRWEVNRQLGRRDRTCSSAAGLWAPSSHAFIPSVYFETMSRAQLPSWFTSTPYAVDCMAQNIDQNDEKGIFLECADVNCP